jgi:hypothetical protein
MAQTAFGVDAAVGNIIQLGQFRCTLMVTFQGGSSTFRRTLGC